MPASGPGCVKTPARVHADLFCSFFLRSHAHGTRKQQRCAQRDSSEGPLRVDSGRSPQVAPSDKIPCFYAAAGDHDASSLTPSRRSCASFEPGDMMRKAQRLSVGGRFGAELDIGSCARSRPTRPSRSLAIGDVTKRASSVNERKIRRLKCLLRGSARPRAISASRDDQLLRRGQPWPHDGRALTSDATAKTLTHWVQAVHPVRPPAGTQYAAQSAIRRVNAPATMPSRNALESARKRNVLTSSPVSARDIRTYIAARYFRLISANVAFVS
jgi:hypothetical protein